MKCVKNKHIYNAKLFLIANADKFKDVYYNSTEDYYFIITCNKFIINIKDGDYILYKDGKAKYSVSSKTFKKEFAMIISASRPYDDDIIYKV